MYYLFSHWVPSERIAPMLICFYLIGYFIGYLFELKKERIGWEIIYNVTIITVLLLISFFYPVWLKIKSFIAALIILGLCNISKEFLLLIRISFLINFGYVISKICREEIPYVRHISEFFDENYFEGVEL